MFRGYICRLFGGFWKKYFLTSEPWLASQVSRMGRVLRSKSGKNKEFLKSKIYKTEDFCSFLRVFGLYDVRKLRWRSVRIDSEVFWHRRGQKSPKMAKIHHLRTSVDTHGPCGTPLGGCSQGSLEIPPTKDPSAWGDHGGSMQISQKHIKTSICIDPPRFPHSEWSLVGGISRLPWEPPPRGVP